jgi:conjugative transfer signal peptidase TraF
MFISAGGGDMNDITAIPGCVEEVCTKTPESDAPQEIKPSERIAKQSYPAYPLRRKKVLIIMTGTLMTLFVAQAFSVITGQSYYINASHSVPLGFYRILPHNKINVGDLVIFDTPQGVHPYIYGRRWLPDGWPLIKYVGAGEGDTYAVLNGIFTIHGRYAGPVYERDSQGKALPYIGGRYRVERNTFLPISTHIDNSFDGRYFGTVPLSAIKGKLKPIWTF